MDRQGEALRGTSVAAGRRKWRRHGRGEGLQVILEVRNGSLPLGKRVRISGLPLRSACLSASEARAVGDGGGRGEES